MILLKTIIFLSSLLLFTACGGSSSDSTTSQDTSSETQETTPATTADTKTDTEEEVAPLNQNDSDTNISKDTTSVVPVDAEVVKQAVVTMDNLTVQVHKNTFDVTSKMYSELNRMLVSYVAMDKAVTDTMDEQMKLLNALAQPFKFADSFKDRFTTDENYTATAPAFVIKKALTHKYFLVSSKTKFFIEGQTIRSYFNDATTLTNAWQRVISNADKSKDLYLTLVEIDESNTMHQVATIFIVKKEKLSSF